MATKKQQQELIDVLKFTPRTYNIIIQGYGGESYAGRVDRKIYDYFKAQKIDIEEYASGWDEFEEMPKEMMPFTPGAPFECDNIFHASGAELSDLNTIEVFDEKGDVHWECSTGLNDLEDKGVTVEEFSNEDFDDLDEGQVVFWGGQGEKGCFFDGEITLTAPFDPSKLKISYETCDGWSIINYVEYDGEDVDGSGGYSTTGKWAENKWVLGGNEEVYTDTVSPEDREDEGLTWDTVPESVCTSEEWDPAKELDKIKVPECGEPVETYVPVLEGEEEWAQKAIDDSMKTEWFDKSINPVHKGEYEVLVDAEWPHSGMRMAKWDGKSWKTGILTIKIHRWRGLKESAE